MWIRETPWEQRNLGVESSAVFHFEDKDTVEALRVDVIDNRDYVYQEAVVPMGRVDLVNALLAGGFRFAEIAIEQSMKPECTLPRAYQRHLGEFSFYVADRFEIAKVFTTIRQGTIFLTDKISMNPRFGPEVAAIRYANWMETELNQDNVTVYMTKCKHESIGFSILKQETLNIVSGLLVGLMDMDRYSGFGVYLGYCTIEAARSMGARCLKAHVSSNNPTVIKLNEMLGYRIDRMDYILTRFLPI